MPQPTSRNVRSRQSSAFRCAVQRRNCSSYSGSNCEYVCHSYPNRSGDPPDTATSTLSASALFSLVMLILPRHYENGDSERSAHDGRHGKVDGKDHRQNPVNEGRVEF